jgi:hypothetical protein
MVLHVHETLSCLYVSSFNSRLSLDFALSYGLLHSPAYPLPELNGHLLLAFHSSVGES